MKRSVLILGLILFAACAVAGYVMASKSGNGSTTGSSAPANAATALAASQQNYLLVQADDLSQPTPKFIQAWIVLTYYSNPPQIIFLPLYPSYDSSQNDAIAGAFAMTSSGRLSSRLEQKIAEQYKVKVDGTILTDASGLDAIAKDFGIANVSASTQAAKNDDDKHAILLGSQSFFQEICAQLKAGDAAKQFDSMQWSQLIPGHFQTDLSFEQLIASWDRVVRSAAPQQCEVLSKE